MHARPAFTTELYISPALYKVGNKVRMRWNEQGGLMSQREIEEGPERYIG